MSFILWVNYHHVVMAASGQPSDKPGLGRLDGRFAQMQEQHKVASPGLAALALKSGNSLLKISICIRVAIPQESGRRGHGVSISNQLSNDGDLLAAVPEPHYDGRGQSILSVHMFCQF